jgi:catechol 2,3-dioxygenase-like lactoylglutathione lyase family enzyme
MRIIKLAWVGTRTDNAEPTVAFFRDVLGLRLELEQPGFWMLKLPDGSKVEVFGPDSEINRHFTTGPVAGFLVDDIQGATLELRSAGVEILFESGSTTAATPGSTSGLRTATFMSSPRTPASPDPTTGAAEDSRLGSNPPW